MRLSPDLRRTTRLAFVSLGLIAALAGCGGDEVTVVPQKIAVAASPNGIAVRAADGAVFITDDQTNSVLSAPDGRSFAHYASVPAVVTGVVPNAAGVAAAVVPVVAGAPDDGGVAIAAAGGVVVAGCVASVGTAAALIEGASIARVHDAVEPVADAVDVAASVAPDDADGIAVAAGAGMLATGCDAVALNDVSIDADGAGVEGCAADTPAVFAAGVGAAAAAGAGERVTESDTGPAAAPIIDDAAGPMADAADDTR